MLGLELGGRATTRPPTAAALAWGMLLLTVIVILLTIPYWSMLSLPLTHR